MKVSRERYAEWLQWCVKDESKKEYNFLSKLKNMLKGNYHMGRKEGFNEAMMTFMGDGPIYVCKHPKQPWPDLAKCMYASLIKEKFIEHLKEQHEIKYNDEEHIDEFHKLVMKDA